VARSATSATVEARVRELAHAGDLAGAATEAIRGLGPDVLRYLRSILRDEDAAREAFSQFAENLWKGLPGFRGDASLRGWAYRLALHAALNLREEAWRRRGRRLATDEASRIAADVRTRTAVRLERQHRALDELREALSIEDRSLLSLRIDQELSWGEIAAVLARDGRPADPAALMKRFERLKARLARLAKAKGLLE
jgi:RNA polymerase sigma-70 factor, ECF subfamily